MNYIPREIEAEFRSTCAEYPVVLVTGVRQAGKSTMLELESPALSVGNGEV